MVVDTTQKITMLCNADMRLRWGMLLRLSQWVTVEQLQREYDFQHWLKKAQEAISAMGVGFQEASEKMYEAFIGAFTEREPIGITCELLDDELDEVQVYSPLLKPLRRIWRERSNNYRKLHALPLIRRRYRCRWRLRESRWPLYSLSPGIAIIDEMHEWKEGRCL